MKKRASVRFFVSAAIADNKYKMKRTSTEDRKRQAAEIHGNKYDYSLWPDHVSLSTVVTNVCKIHGEFSHTVRQHVVLKSGCPQCAGKNVPTEDRKKQAAEIHNNKYDYSLWPPNPTVRGELVTSVCPIHGPFDHTLNTHIHRRCGCPGCVLDAQRSNSVTKYGVRHHKQQHFTPDTIERLQDGRWLHDQHVTEQRSQLDIAAELGINPTTVGRYLEQYGVEKQYGMGSIPERAMADWIATLGVNVTRNTRTIIPPYELDVYIPDHNIAVEYCGLYWHSEQAGKDKWYHKTKRDMCERLGIRLLTVFEDEWLTRQQAVKSKIRSVLGVDNRETVMARKCSVVPVGVEAKKTFFDEYHVQGDGPSGVNYALVYANEIVAIAGFIQTGTEYRLNRYATSKRVVGGSGKLVSYLKRHHVWSRLVTFADLRWSNGNLYTQTGWMEEKLLPPDYYCSVDAVNREHKFNFRRSALPRRLQTFDPNLSERQNCDNNGVLRIWDCGKIRFAQYPNSK